MKEIKKPSRAKNPPHKSKDYEGWFKWYTEEVRQRIAKGENKQDIMGALGISNIDKFLENGK